MKFLGDMCVSPVSVEFLRHQGYEAIHLVEQKLERLRDSEIIIKAISEERIILTFDLDFGELLAINQTSLPSVIIFRLENTKPSFVNSRLMVVISECAQQLEKGAIITVQDNRYRLRNLPI